MEIRAASASAKLRQSNRTDKLIHRTAQNSPKAQFYSYSNAWTSIPM